MEGGRYTQRFKNDFPQTLHFACSLFLDCFSLYHYYQHYPTGKINPHHPSFLPHAQAINLPINFDE